MVNSMFQWLSISLIALLHPFYVSVIDINHNTKEESVEMSIRIFTQDLEETLQKYSTAKIDMVHPTNKAVLDKQIKVLSFILLFTISKFNFTFSSKEHLIQPIF